MSFASLNHFLKLRIEKPTTSPLAGLTLRNKDFIKGDKEREDRGRILRRYLKKYKREDFIYKMMSVR